MLPDRWRAIPAYALGAARPHQPRYSFTAANAPVAATGRRPHSDQQGAS